jgi:hypothetical protein
LLKSQGIKRKRKIPRKPCNTGKPEAIIRSFFISFLINVVFRFQEWLELCCSDRYIKVPIVAIYFYDGVVLLRKWKVT